MNGFLCVLKPPGMTSAQVVGRVKRLFPKEKIGHGGTLDPQTAGVLPIMLGKGTRLFDYMLEKEKEYIAEIFFGIETDTQDGEGAVIGKSGVYPSQVEIVETLKAFEGEIFQTPPSYSALKVNGIRAYDLARQGKEVYLAKRKVTISAITPLWYKGPNRQGIKVRCSKGTYVRTLCTDIGKKLGCPSHMSFLLRSQSGIFTLDQGKTLEELTQAKEEGTLEELLLPLDFPVSHIPKSILPQSQQEHFLYGRPMDKKAFPPFAQDEVFRLYNPWGLFLGMAWVQGEQVRLKTYLQGID